MADWNFYLAYNLFRMAAITQGIAKRVRSTAPRPAPGQGHRRSHAHRWPNAAGPSRRGLNPRQAKETVMDFSYSPRTQDLQARLEELKPKARAAGLWNLFLPPRAESHEEALPSGYGIGLTNLRIRAAGRDHGRGALGQRGLQLLGARHRQHGDHRTLRHAPSTRSAGSSRCWPARSARPSP
jgi:hypothetical protein